MPEQAHSSSIKPLEIHGDGRFILAPDEAAARAYYDGDPVVLTSVGWMQNVGWDRENYDLKREFVADTGMTDWWESCGPPAHGGPPTKKILRAWRVTYS